MYLQLVDLDGNVVGLGQPGLFGGVRDGGMSATHSAECHCAPSTCCAETFGN